MAVSSRRQPIRTKRRSDLIPCNVHFSSNTREALRIHSAITDSGGISALVRTIVEFYLSEALNFDDPRYRDIDTIKRPEERYVGHHKKLGL